MTAAKTIHEQLSEQGAKRRRSKRLRAEAAAELEKLVPRAHDAGVSITEIGKLADLSRPAVYALLVGISDPRDRRR
jgi:hypothetical protein